MRPARRCSIRSRARGRTIWTVQTLSSTRMTRLPRRQLSKVAGTRHKRRLSSAVCHLSFTEGSMPDNDGSEDTAMSWLPDKLSWGEDNLSGVGDSLSGVDEDRLSWVAGAGAAGPAPDSESPVLGDLSRVASSRPSTAIP
jgi:hypothetical protein